MNQTGNIDETVSESGLVVHIKMNDNIRELVKRELKISPNHSDIILFNAKSGIYVVSTHVDGKALLGRGVAKSEEAGIRLAYRNAYKPIMDVPANASANSEISYERGA